MHLWARERTLTLTNKVDVIILLSKHISTLNGSVHLTQDVFHVELRCKDSWADSCREGKCASLLYAQAHLPVKHI